MSGYEEPNYTQTPNAFFDVVMPQIDSITELKVTLAVIRQTFGWQKPGGDTISLSQLEKLTGLPRKSVVDGVSRALKRGSVVRKKVGNSYSYRLKVVTTGNQQSDEGSYQGLPKVVTTGNPQKKEKESYSRRDAGASKKPNYFKDFCDDMAKVGLTVDDDHRKTIPKNLTYLIEKKGATPSEMVQVIWKMVEARARAERPYELSPQKALDQVRGIKPALSLVQPPPTSVSPDCVVNALSTYNRDGITDLQDFAPLARKWDFTLAEKPPWDTFRDLGGNDEERGRNLKRIQSVATRAMRSVG